MPTVHPEGFYPVLMCPDPVASAAFWRELLGFTTSFESEWYISLRLGEFELALIDADHESIPVDYRAPARGVLLNLEVTDAGALHETLLERGVRFALPMRDEAWGQRHFIVEAPDGVLLDVIQPIEPSPEFAAAYLPIQGRVDEA